MLEENWEAVQVFQRCQQTWVANMGGAYALGFSALEVAAGCRLVGIAAADVMQVSEQAQEMGGVAATALNARKG